MAPLLRSYMELLQRHYDLNTIQLLKGIQVSPPSALKLADTQGPIIHFGLYLMQFCLQKTPHPLDPRDISLT